MPQENTNVTPMEPSIVMETERNSEDMLMELKKFLLKQPVTIHSSRSGTSTPVSLRRRIFLIVVIIFSPLCNRRQNSESWRQFG